MKRFVFNPRVSKEEIAILEKACLILQFLDTEHHLFEESIQIDDDEIVAIFDHMKDISKVRGAISKYIDILSGCDI